MDGSIKMKITQTYLKKELKEEMQNHFDEQGFIQLNSFLDEDLNSLKNILLKETTNHIYKPLETSSKLLGEQTRYDPNIILFLEYFKSKEFTSFLEEITGFSLTPKKCEVHKYEHKDYTLLNDTTNPEDDTIEVLFDLSDSIPNDAGGTLIYTTQSEEVLYLEPTYNALTILYRPKELLSYLKYINRNVNNKKILRVEMNFTLLEQ